MAGLEFFSAPKDESWKEVVTAAGTMGDIFNLFQNPHKPATTEFRRNETLFIYTDVEIPSVLMSLAYTQKSFSGVEWLLLNDETVLLESLSQLDKWLLITISSAKPDFAERVEKILRRYRSSNADPKPSLIETHFGNIMDVINGINKASFMERSRFMGLLSRSGNREILRPFFEAGVDVHEHTKTDAGRWERDYLSQAMVAVNKETFDVLLEYGAVPGEFPPENLTIVQGHERKIANTEEYPYFFDKALERFCEKHNPILCFLASERAMKSRPDLLEKLLKKAPSDRLIGRGLPTCSNTWCQFWNPTYEEPVFQVSALWWIVLGGHSQALQLLIDLGAQVNSHIGCGYIGTLLGQDVSKFTWLSLAVRLGKVDCVDTLLRNGADPYIPERAGLSILEVSRAFVNFPHPRQFQMTREVVCDMIPKKVQITVTAEEDKSILSMVESALAKNPELYNKIPEHNEESESQQAKPIEAVSVPGEQFGLSGHLEGKPKRRMPLPGSLLEQAVAGIRKWVRLPHSERILIGIGLTFSYSVLVAYTIFLAFIELSKMRRLPKSAWVAILIAVLVWKWNSDQQ